MHIDSEASLQLSFTNDMRGKPITSRLSNVFFFRVLLASDLTIIISVIHDVLTHVLTHVLIIQ